MTQPHHNSLRSTRRRIHSQRGSVILFVLGMVLLTAFMLTRFIDRAHTELLTEAKHGQKIPLRQEAYSALQVTLAVLADIAAVDEGLHSPQQGWGEPLTYAEYNPPEGIQIEAVVEDETGKFSLPKADDASLITLLMTMGLLNTEAERITDAILAWTQLEYPPQFSDSGQDAFQRREPALLLPQRPMRSFEELRLMPAVLEILCEESGEWNELGRRFLQSVSLFSFDQVNLNTGQPDVLSALGLSDPTVRSLTDRNLLADGLGPQPYYSLREAALDLGTLPESSQLGIEATIFRIIIRTSQGGRTFELVAIAQRGRSRPPPPSREDEEPPTSEPRPWTLNSIDSPFQILEIRENDGF